MSDDIDIPMPRQYWQTDGPPGPLLDCTIGRYFRAHWRRRLATTAEDYPDAVSRISRQMRKQGIPLQLARLMLCLPESAFHR